MLEQLRSTIARMERPPGFEDPGRRPLGLTPLDAALGGGLARGSLHEVSAVSEAHVTVAAGFILGIARSERAQKNNIVWIAEDMAIAESGAPYGCGLDEFGLPPERLLLVNVSHRRDLLWAMEEALHCRAVGAVIGELRHASIDAVALRRLSLAAAASGALAFLLRSSPTQESSTAANALGSSALHRRSRAMDRALHALKRNSCAIAVDRSDPGCSNGMRRMSVLFLRQRILSLWLPRLSTDRSARSCARSPEAKPTAVYGKRGNLDLIVALDLKAERLGLHKGLAMAQARAMHPAIVAVEEEPHADAKLLDMLADWCLRYTPLVACDGRDGLLLDITGCAHLYGGEAALIADLAERLRRAGLAQRMAVAGTIGAAYAAARYGKPSIHENGGERELLATMPMAALRVETTVSASLARVGLKLIDDIIDLPRAPLAARFGAGLLRQLDRALGHEEEPLTPRLPVAPYIAEQRFAEPIAREEDVLAVTEQLADRLKTMLERRGDGVRKLELALFRTDGALRRLSAGTSRPVQDPHEIRALFVQRLAALNDDLDPGFGFDMARLSVTAAEPCTDEQIGLNDSDTGPALSRLIDHLSARLGGQRVRKLIAQDSHVPELATSLPAQIKSEDDGWTAFRRYRDEQGIGPRPLRLLSKPEPIKAIAEVPNGPPQRFWWRNALHEVVAAEGPERIERVWWTDEGGKARDYFRVEDQSGLRFWLFRAGLYRDLSQQDWDASRFPQWFMHGAFG